MAVLLDKVQDNELPDMAEMAGEIWSAYYPAIIGEKQTAYMLDMMYKPEALLQQKAERGETYYWIISGGQRVGFLSAAPKEDNVLFIHKLYVLSSLQGKGLGSEVFGILQDLYPWFNSFRLTVNRKNIQAINFYFKNGFSIEKAEDFDIGNGYFMEDFVMQRKFAQKQE